MGARGADDNAGYGGQPGGSGIVIIRYLYDPAY
jgi:hypothetical protein